MVQWVVQWERVEGAARDEEMRCGSSLGEDWPRGTVLQMVEGPGDDGDRHLGALRKPHNQQQHESAPACIYQTSTPLAFPKQAPVAMHLGWLCPNVHPSWQGLEVCGGHGVSCHAPC